MPSKAIELASFDMYKKTLGRLRPGGSSSHPGGLATGVAGAFAGVCDTWTSESVIWLLQDPDKALTLCVKSLYGHLIHISLYS